MRLENSDGIGELGDIQNNGSHSQAFAQVIFHIAATNAVTVTRGSSTSVYGSVSGVGLSKQEKSMEIYPSPSLMEAHAPCFPLLFQPSLTNHSILVCLSNIDLTGQTSPLYNLSHAPTAPLIDRCR